MGETFNCLIMGAAGRDFHDFQMFFRDRPQFHVCAFTATQIPFIESRTFPRSLAGPNYSADIPIFPESQLPDLIRRFHIEFAFFAYSDISHVDLMHKASWVQSCGASFVLLGPRQTQLNSQKPVIAVTAVRTGAGKSPLSQWLSRKLTDDGRHVGIIRHPMPYGDLERQAVERLASFDDLQRFQCTIEEREEYEPYLEQGLIVLAGVNYQAILKIAEAEADVILWDGGNNDFSFIRPDVTIVVVDALRPGHEILYYPGETNLRQADIVVINKVREASVQSLSEIRQRVQSLNPRATVIESDLSIAVDQPELITGRRVLVIEDGPTLTHGGMSYGAGTLAARQFGAGEIIDPRSAAVGTLAEIYRQYPHLGDVVPALGYSTKQCGELAQTIEHSGADLVIDASPCRLDRILELKTKVVRVSCRFQQTAGIPLYEEILQRMNRSEV
ncbi:MAG: cyclic 2,3-diphosphoglycerate synthase [Planctomycetaceae bacterium]